MGRRELGHPLARELMALAYEIEYRFREMEEAKAALEGRITKGWIEAKMVRCGKCRLCRMGIYAHGPYYYYRYRDGGVVRSVYLGKGSVAREAVVEKLNPEDIGEEERERLIEEIERKMEILEEWIRNEIAEIREALRKVK